MILINKKLANQGESQTVRMCFEIIFIHQFLITRLNRNLMKDQVDHLNIKPIDTYLNMCIQQFYRTMIYLSMELC